MNATTIAASHAEQIAQGEEPAPSLSISELTLRACLQICGSMVKAPEDVIAKSIEALQGINPRDFRSVRRTCAKAGTKLKPKSKDIGKACEKDLPAIACFEPGVFMVVAKVDPSEENVLLFNPIAGAAEVQTYDWVSTNLQGRLHKIEFSQKENPTTLTLRWFIEAFFNYKSILFEILGSSIFVNTLGLLIPLFFQVIIDKVISNQAVTTLDVLASVLLIGIFLEVVITGIRQYVMQHTTTRIDVILGTRIYDHLIHLPLSYFQARRIGESVARVREIDKIREFMSKASLALTVDLLFIFVFIGVMWVFSPFLTLIVISSIPVYALISVGLTPTLQERIEETFKAGANKETFLVETISGIETVKASAIEAATHRSWEERLSEFVKSNFRASTISAFMSNFYQLTGKATTVAVLFLGAHLVINGDMTVGQLIAFNMLVGQVNAPILKIAQLWQDFQRAKLSVDRLNDVLQAPIEYMTPLENTASEISGDICFDNVSFSYQPGGQPVIANLSIKIPAGQSVGIVGTSGSGKSTLTKLIQRLYAPQQGKIWIDDQDISALDATYLRGNIGVVLQENLLFKRTVRENIALADPAASMSRIIDSAKLAGAHQFILELAQGYDTVIDEMGANLSGGQRQRIAIARALLTKPSILIFDEATSALDYESEEIIQKNMKKICAGRTVLIVAHRLSAVRDADRIIALEKGEIVEDGDHDTLIATGGRYATLYRVQSGDTENQTDA